MRSVYNLPKHFESMHSSHEAPIIDKLEWKNMIFSEVISQVTFRLALLFILVYFPGRGTLSLYKKEEAGFRSILDDAFC